jgi:glycine/D-amino acid oxidase-like deaminating enzyme
MYLLETARSRGVRFESGRVTGVDLASGRVTGVRLSSGERLDSPIFINAAGPYLKEVGKLLGIDLPVHTELHLKAALKDPLGVVGRAAPLLIWPIAIAAWTGRAAWRERRFALLTDRSSGVHVRPRGSPKTRRFDVVGISNHHEPVWPPSWMNNIPKWRPGRHAAGEEYFSRMPRPQLDGGYYTKTRENRPLVGPTRVDGAHVIGAVSGYGIMSACGVGELLAAHVTGAELPSYANAFALERYDDPEYQRRLENWGDKGQL